MVVMDLLCEEPSCVFCFSLKPFDLGDKRYMLPMEDVRVPSIKSMMMMYISSEINITGW
ncbi:hypothetical protein Hanom_Chr02g00145721 [Helianthus anomalus]